MSLAKGPFSPRDVSALAQAERSLLLFVLIGLGIALVGVVAAAVASSWALVQLVTLLRVLAGLFAVYFYFRLLQGLRVPGAWAYGVLAAACSVFLPLIFWIMVAVHLSRVHKEVFVPQGYKIGLLGPK